MKYSKVPLFAPGANGRPKQSLEQILVSPKAGMLFEILDRSILCKILSGIQRCPWFFCRLNGWRENNVFLRPGGIKTPTWRCRKIWGKYHSVGCLILDDGIPTDD